MTLSVNDVKRIADLAYIEIDDDVHSHVDHDLMQ